MVFPIGVTKNRQSRSSSSVIRNLTLCSFLSSPDVSIEPVTFVFESSRLLEAEDKFLHIAEDLTPSAAG